MRDPKRLRETLRRGDPARPMTREEAERIRGAVLREAARSEDLAPSPLRSHWGMITALASTVVLAVSLGWGLRERPDAPVQEELARPRQIQFETPGGTRIIWVLQPGENLSRGER
jgi:hypothetical protein